MGESFTDCLTIDPNEHRTDYWTVYYIYHNGRTTVSDSFPVEHTQPEFIEEIIRDWLTGKAREITIPFDRNQRKDVW